MRHKIEVTRRIRAHWQWRAFQSVGVLFVILAGVAAAGAQEYRGTEGQRMACTGDVFRLCWSDIPNVSRIVSCLAREKRQLSAGCRAVFDHNSSVRVAYDRWQHRHRHLASSGDQQTQPQTDHRDVTVASVETTSVGLATAKDTRAKASGALFTHQSSHSQSKAARMHSRSKYAFGHSGKHHRYGRLHRHHPATRHRYAFSFGKQYRYHD